MDWMRYNTPEPSVPIDASVRPWRGDGGYRYAAGTYGVFCPWDFGNMVSALGRRVPVWSRWPASRTAQWILCEDEESSLRLLCEDCRDDEAVRYVVLEARTVAQYFLANAVLLSCPLTQYDTGDKDWFTVKGTGGASRVLHRTHGPRYRQSMAVRLYLDDGRDVGHYRLIYESPHQSYITYLLEDVTYVFWRTAFPIDSTAERDAYSARLRKGSITRAGDHYEYDGAIASTVKIFERVAGARLTGTATVGLTVEAHLPLYCGYDRRLVQYARTTVAGTDGRFDLVVAHPTEGSVEDAACVASGPYRIYVRSTPQSSATQVRTVSVAAEQILSGGSLDLGRLF